MAGAALAASCDSWIGTNVWTVTYIVDSRREVTRRGCYSKAVVGQWELWDGWESNALQSS